jgi:hypothetical protein
MTRHRRSLVAALALAGALAGGSAAQAQDVIKIGAPLPLTGPLSPEGSKQQRGNNLWAETVNAKGGIKAGGKTYKVEIVYVDYASNTPRAVQSAERLITEDKVNFLFSPFGSGAAKGGTSANVPQRSSLRWFTSDSWSAIAAGTRMPRLVAEIAAQIKSRLKDIRDSSSVGLSSHVIACAVPTGIAARADVGVIGRIRLEALFQARVQRP